MTGFDIPISRGAFAFFVSAMSLFSQAQAEQRIVSASEECSRASAGSQACWLLAACIGDTDLFYGRFEQRGNDTGYLLGRLGDGTLCNGYLRGSATYSLRCVSHDGEQLGEMTAALVHAGTQTTQLFGGMEDGRPIVGWGGEDIAGFLEISTGSPTLSCGNYSLGFTD